VIARALGLLVALACKEPRAERPNTAPAPYVVVSTRVDPDARAVGLSGLARSANGVLWAVPERRRELVTLDPTRSPFVSTGVPLVGVPDGVDTEALALLDDGTAVLGTETQRPKRVSDQLLFVTPGKSEARVSQVVALSYAPWKMTADTNRGIEGLCAAGHKLVVAVETVIVSGGARYAPVAVYDLDKRSWTHHRLHLGSKDGKVSALACKPAESDLALWAIERHYGTMRLLEATVGASELIEPSAAYDLEPLLATKPNIEGLELGPDGTLVLLSDNDTGGVTGPAQLITLRHR
jgi:hypothetical protein